MKTWRAPLLAGFLLLTSYAPLFSEEPSAEPTARDIVKRSDDLMRGDTQKGTYAMTVVTPQWSRHLEIFIHSKGRDRIHLRILSPAKEKGITTLRVANEMWNYLPQVERTIKIPPSMMLEPWMGSDFANDDLVKESSVVEDYDHRIIMTAKLKDGRTAHIIELNPKPQAGVVWSKRLMWIDKDDATPIREEFFGKGNKRIKVLMYTNVRQVGDRKIPTTWEMTNELKKGRRTIIEVEEDVVYNTPIDDTVFSLQNLK